ncbi:MAG: ferritin-like domain-containing protein [Pseudomonadota bacterium]|nr:ferritin-like domain-containing protein [Pseudomonadota bacterium]
METWTLKDIPWDHFDKTKVNPQIIPVVKAASMVEYNADDYRHYLNCVFRDDKRICAAINHWSIEEVQHGEALGRWAKLADPSFDFDRSFDRFVCNFKFPLDVTQSVRGSRASELVARCMVETGTSSFYRALADATDEPVLKEVCSRIAEDEFAHYCLFHTYLRKYLRMENLSFIDRLRVAFSRVAETEDDELASAYWAANRAGEHFDRRSNAVAYARETLKYYRPAHINRAVDMIFGALGLDPRGPGGWLATRAVRIFIWYRGRLCPRMAFCISRLHIGWCLCRVLVSRPIGRYDAMNRANSSRTPR